LSVLETKVAEVAAATAARPSSADPPGGVMANERQQDAQRQYELDLLHQRQVIAQHETEPSDPGWARVQAAAIHDVLAAAIDRARPFQIDSVDCRNKTCVARLIYETPDDALEHRGKIGKALVEGCNGISSSLEPPTSPGLYDVKVIYYCR
jgi:hypothetical protein